MACTRSTGQEAGKINNHNTKRSITERGRKEEREREREKEREKMSERYRQTRQRRKRKKWNQKKQEGHTCWVS